ncbi:MAG: 50S ribosomal protein L10 [bacterium]
MPRPEKIQQTEAIRDRLQRSGAIIFTDFRGLNVGEIAALREKLRAAGVEYRVVKNTLLGRAAASLGIDGLDAYLEGPTAAAFSAEDPVAPAKIIQDYIRAARKLEVKGGLVEGRVLSAGQIKQLADLPAKPELLAKALGSIVSPLYGLMAVMTGLQRNLVYALDQVRQKMEAA